MPSVSGSFSTATLVESAEVYQLNSGLVSRVLTLDGLFNAYGVVPVGGSGATETIHVTNRTGGAVPLGATIDGITITIWRMTNSALTTVTDSVIRLLKAGVAAGDNKASSDQYPTSVVPKSYGGSSDLWGTTWSVADVNSTSWGLSIAGAIDDSVAVDGGLPYWDAITYKIDYTEVSGTPDPTPSAKRYWLDGGGEYAQRFASPPTPGRPAQATTPNPYSRIGLDISDFSEIDYEWEDDDE